MPDVSHPFANTSSATLHIPNPSPHTPLRNRSPRREETQDSEKAGRVWARSVDDPWWPCILTCDGGGIRGYSTLLILKALMHEVWLWEKYYDELEENDVAFRSESPVDSRFGGESELEGGRGRPPGVIFTAPDTNETDGQSSSNITNTSGKSFTTAIPTAASTILQQDTATTSHTKSTALSEQELLPCHYFDFMYGTSTGGLIATILGRLRMTVEEGLELYRKVGNDLFGTKRSSIPLMTKYYHEPLEAAVRAVVAERCRDHEECDGCDLFPWPEFSSSSTTAHPSDSISDLADLPIFDVDQPRVCQSACLTATHDGNLTEAYLLRTYPLYYNSTTPNWITRYNEGADPLPIWTVTRATSAAPFYFEMVTFPSPSSSPSSSSPSSQKVFKDGGIRENNPSGAAYSEFHALYANRAPHPALLLSLGTGLPNRANDGFADATAATSLPTPLNRIPGIGKFLENLAVFKNVLIKYTEGEHQHVAMRNAAKGEFTWYKRLNVEGLEMMGLDDWRRGVYEEGWVPSTGLDRRSSAAIPEIEPSKAGQVSSTTTPAASAASASAASHASAAVSATPTSSARQPALSNPLDTTKGKIIPGGATLTEMERLTSEYLSREFDPKRDSYARPYTVLTQAAQKLVLQRRERQREGGERWDVFVGKKKPATATSAVSAASMMGDVGEKMDDESGKGSVSGSLD